MGQLPQSSLRSCRSAAMSKLSLACIVLSFAFVAAEDVGIMRSSNLRGSPPSPLEHNATLSNTSTTFWDAAAEDELDMIGANMSEIAFNQDMEISNNTSVENASISEVNLTRWWRWRRWYCRFRWC